MLLFKFKPDGYKRALRFFLIILMCYFKISNWILLMFNMK